MDNPGKYTDETDSSKPITEFILCNENLNVNLLILSYIYIN